MVYKTKRALAREKGDMVPLRPLGKRLLCRWRTCQRFFEVADRIEKIDRWRVPLRLSEV